MNQTFKLALAGALCAFPTLAAACSCAPPPAPEIALQESAAVFVGRVTSVEKSDFSNKYQFSVSKQWKGIEGKTASIVTATDSAACGIGFDENRDYLIYAFKTEGDNQLRTNLCSRTKRAADATADLAALGAPVADYPAATTYPTDDNGVVQVNAAKDSDPLMALIGALQNDKSSQRFRLNWGYGSIPFRSQAPAGNATALFDREKSTLKLYSPYQTPNSFGVFSVFYSDVTEQMLSRLADKQRVSEETVSSLALFNGLTELGATKKDMGSKAVRLSA